MAITTYTVITVCPAMLRETWTIRRDGPLSEGDAYELIQANADCVEFEEQDSNDEPSRRIVVLVEEAAT
jgi:hypothetical protein